MTSAPDVPDIVEALFLFSEPMLNSRYHGMLHRRGAESPGLARLPELALEAEHLARVGTTAWAAVPSPQDEAFLRWAERAVLEGFLSLSEMQLVTGVHIARSAPTHPARVALDGMVEKEREIVRALRQALHERPAMVAGKPRASHVQTEQPASDFRGQLEAALRRTERAGSGVERIVLSPIAARHLRDQGLFAEDETTVHGHAVVVDMGWTDSSAFVVETSDQVRLDEIARRAGE